MVFNMREVKCVACVCKAGYILECGPPSNCDGCNRHESNWIHPCLRLPMRARAR